MSKVLPSEENQESEIDALLSPISSPPHDHFNSDLQNEESIISEFLKLEDKGKRPMSELYELKPIDVPTFSNLEQGGTSENEVKEEDDYDINHDLAILKSIHHYYFNHGVVPLKFRGQALVAKIGMLENDFLSVRKIAAEYDLDIIHPICREIFYLSMGLWG
ncbi:unnamed protein product [Withania somnifera]